MTFHASGAHRSSEAGAASVLRLLPSVHHPPARVLVPGGQAAHAARALDARGYRVTLVDAAAPEVPGVARLAADFLAGADGGFDLLCDQGFFETVAPAARPAWAASAARALRPGGKLFGSFFAVDGASAPPWGVSASELCALLSGAFDVQLLGSGSPPTDGAGPTRLEAVFVRR